LHIETYPDFRIGDYSDLVEILGLQKKMRVEAYNRFQRRWDCHTLDTVQQVETGETLLFRKLPGGVTGPRLQNCPGLEVELKQLIEAGTLSRKRTRENEPKLTGLIRSPNVVKNTRTFSNNQGQVMSTSQMRRGSRQIASPSPSKESRVVETTSRFWLSPTVISPTNVSTPHRTGADVPMDSVLPLHSVALGDCPWVGQRLRNGERAWPTSFFAIDIIEGFIRIDQLRTQRRPKFYQGTAFEMVFGLQYHRSTFHKHYKVYMDNLHLIPKYQSLGRSPKGSWTRFVAEACQEVSETSETEQPSTESSIEESVVEDTNQCPSCNELLPDQPSPLLQRLRMELDKAVAATHRFHPNRQPIDATAYCQQHRFEAIIEPEAEIEGWPQVIDFQKLNVRLEELTDVLREIEGDPEDSVFFGYLNDSIQRLGKNQAFGNEGAKEFGEQYGHATG